MTTMYILYFFEQNYDGGDFTLIKSSKDKSKLVALKDKLESDGEAKRKTFLDWMDRQKNFYKTKCNEVADWFEQNMDAILEYPRGQKYGKWDKMGDGSFSVAGLYRSERDYPDWHTSKTTPYHPDTVIKDKMIFIEEIRNCGGYDPWQRYEVYVDHDKVKTPFPTPENFTEEQPVFNGAFFTLGSLSIEEIELI